MDQTLLQIITEEVLAALAARGITVREANNSRTVCRERLITEAAAFALCKNGVQEVHILSNALVTPSAWDVFKEKKVKVNRDG